MDAKKNSGYLRSGYFRPDEAEVNAGKRGKAAGQVGTSIPARLERRRGTRGELVP